MNVGTLDLVHRYLKLRVRLGGFFVWWIWNMLRYRFRWLLFEHQFCLVIKMDTATCFFGVFNWKVLFLPFILRYCLSLMCECFLYAAKSWALFIYPVCYSMSNLWGALSLLILKHIKEWCVLIPVIFFGRGGIILVCLLSLFCCKRTFFLFCDEVSQLLL